MGNSIATAEQELLGALLLDGSAIGEVADLIEPADFADATRGRVFEAILRSFSNGDPITTGGLATLGFDADYLSQLRGLVATSANAVYHAGLVKKDSRRRGLGSRAHEIGTEAEAGVDPDELAEKIQQAALDFADRRLVDQMRPIDDDLVEAVQLAEAAQKAGGRILGLRTGFGTLDWKVGGIRPGQLVILAARPGLGKSALCLNVATNILKGTDDLVVMLFSLEMARIEISQRVIASEGLLDLRDLGTGYLEDKYLAHAFKIVDEVRAWGKGRLIVNDSGSMSANGVRAAVQKTQLRHNVGLVIVDYLQLMQGNKSYNRNDEVAEISRSLKMIARDLEVPVLALSQLNRQVEHRDGAPRLADLRDSGAIEQDADVVLFIYEDSNGHCLKIAKNRNGPLWDFPVLFNKEHVRFYEVDVNREEGVPRCEDPRQLF